MLIREERPRPVCPDCGLVYWRNPIAAVAVILRDGEGRVLLARRTGSYRGRWCIPCGHIEEDEEIRAAGVREMLEETGYRVELGGVYAVLSNFHDPAVPSVGVWFTGRIAGGEERPGGDVDALVWADPASPPQPLAFPTDVRVLEALAAGRERA